MTSVKAMLTVADRISCSVNLTRSTHVRFVSCNEQQLISTSQVKPELCVCVCEQMMSLLSSWSCQAAEKWEMEEGKHTLGKENQAWQISIYIQFLLKVQGQTDTHQKPDTRARDSSTHGHWSILVWSDSTWKSGQKGSYCWSNSGYSLCCHVPVAHTVRVRIALSLVPASSDPQIEMLDYHDDIYGLFLTIFHPPSV